MIKEQLEIIKKFEDRVHQVMFLCNKLKEENVDLLSQLKVQKNVNNSLTEENKQMKIKYDNLMMAQTIHVSMDDFKTTKERLSKLVRDVDECILLLNT